MKSSLNDDEIVAGVYPFMGYDAVGMGDQEFVNGIGFIRNYLSGKLPLVSSNLEFTDKSIKIEKSRIIQVKNGIKVGVTAVNFATDFKYLMRNNTIKETDIIVDKAFDNLRKSLNELKGKCDIIVVLANLNQEGLVKMLDNVDGYDLVLAGNNGEEFVYARRIENKIHVQNGRDGEKIGKVVYDVSAGAKPKFLSYELIRINTKIYKRNEAVEKIIKDLGK